MSTSQSLTTAASTLILEEMLGVTSGTRGAVYLALTTTDPGESGVMTGELSGNGYARVAITFGAASAGSISNSAECAFPEATAAWTGVAYAAIMDASTGGTCLARDSVTGSIGSGQIASFDVGDIAVNRDTGYVTDNWFDTEMLDWLFRGQAMTAKDWYCSLHTGASTTGNEVSWTGYSRQAVTPSDWDVISNYARLPQAAVSFGPLTTGDYSGSVGGGLWDAATGGNLLHVGAGTLTMDVPDGSFLINNVLTYRIGVE